MKLKVCGLKYSENIIEVASLLPDFVGFIFWDKSKRYFNGKIPVLPISIQKVGVFVDAEIDFILNKIAIHKLDFVQLHGKESIEFCKRLKEKNTKIIKAFSINVEFDFKQVAKYSEVCDYFLFDTKGRLPGGNGTSFEWSVLKNYKLTIPYFLSGGIGLGNAIELKEFFTKTYATNCIAIDVNSKFEIKPGLKNSSELKKLKKYL